MVSVLALLLSLPPACAATLTTAARVYEGTLVNLQPGDGFCLTGVVTYATTGDREYFGIQDPSGSARLHWADGVIGSPVLAAGDRIVASGATAPFNEYVHAFCSNVAVLAHGPVPQPLDIRAADAYDGTHAFALVRVSGTVCDAFRDEIDARYVFLVINDGSASISVTCHSSDTTATVPTKLIGRQATVTGICASVRGGGGSSRQLGQTIAIESLADVVPTDGSAPDRFAVPEIPDRLIWNPSDANALRSGRVSGHVLAVWQGKNVLIETPGKHLSRVTLLDDLPPRYGDFVEAAGFQETDLFQINLTRAAWRPARTGATFVPEKPQRVNIASLLSDEEGRAKINSRFNGRTVLATGRIHNLPATRNDNSRFWLDDDGLSICVDASSAPAALDHLQPGCKITVTGTCITDAETWHPNAPFPRAKSNFLVLRSPGDVVILSYPSWWTPKHLLITMGVLVLLLIAAGIWNILLNRLAERRGHALADERIAHVESELKIRERTRLAVELHDSISQVLSGVALEVNAAKRLAQSDAELTIQHLTFAAKSLSSCREELHNCMWDLRNLTLDESDINDAIRRTLHPHLGKARLTVRFNVPRERLSDNTAHTFLCIIRELAVNAVRHGRATEIRVAGTIEGDRLIFSVTDNGCGFDPRSCPGPDQGHFGLQGIRERIKGFGGTFDFECPSAPSGTRAVIAIRIPSGKLP